MNKNESILERVRALIAKADGTEFPAEADAFRAKADELMTRYAIEQWQVDAAQQATNQRPEPVSRVIDMHWYINSPHQGSLWALMLQVASHCRVRLVYWQYNGNIPAVGLPSDLDYFEMLFTSLMLQFSSNMEPKPMPGRTMIENLVAMKEAGMKWERIGELLIAAGQLEGPYTRNMGVRFTKLYSTYCRENDRPQLRTNPQVYQRSYSEGFVSRISERLRDLRQGFNKDAKGSGSELVLADIKHEVDRLAIELYGAPERVRSKQVTKNYRYDRNAALHGRHAGNSADISAHQGSRLQQRGQING